MAIITGTAGPDTLNGTFGDDQIEGLDGDDVIHGGGGEDEILGGEGTDNLSGDADDDVIFGGAGDDIISGGAGDDRVQGGAGDDQIDGGAGRDSLEFGADVLEVVVDLEAGTAVGDGNDSLEDIDNVDGTAGDDVLTGNDGANRLYGGGGADTIYGGDGNDLINGDTHDSDGRLAMDRIDAGDGDDTVTVGPNDIAEGGAGFDILEISLDNLAEGAVVDLGPMWSGGVATVGPGTVSGFERLAYIFATEHADTITIGTGGSVPEVGFAPPVVLGAGGSDQLTGGEDRDGLGGGDDNDILLGLGGDDQLDGGQGDDWIEGGAGDDRMMGGMGADRMIGGVGGDTYVYSIYSGGAYPDGDQIVENPADAGADKLLMHLWVPVGDAAFTGVRNVEAAELTTLTDLPGAEAVLGAEFQATGIRTVIASADVDASQLSAGLNFVVTAPGSRGLTVTAGSGGDVFRFGEDTLPAFINNIVVVGGAGFDTLHLDHGGQEQPGWVGGQLLFSEFELIVLGGGTDAIAVTNGRDIPGLSESYSFTLTDAMVAAGTRLTIDASDLRADIAVSLGDDEEIGGSGWNEDLIASDQLVLDASQLTGDRAVQVSAGAGADTLTGSANGDLLDGRAGDDILDGGEGDDRLEGGNGADTISGGGGDDEIVEEDAHWDSDFGIDRLDGGEGDDLIWAGSNDSIDGGSGFDTLDIQLSRQSEGTTIDLTAMWGGGTGSNGAGTVHGFERLRLISGSDAADVVILGTLGGVQPSEGGPAVHGWGGDDRLTGGGQRDSLIGGDGDDVLVGLGDDDLLRGDQGDDRIEGGEGDDLLDGWLGADVLIGGAGSDTYDYHHDAFPNGDLIVENAGDPGIDLLFIRPDLVPVPDSAFAGVRNLELAELITLGDLPGVEFTLGGHFQATGIRSIIASADIDASQVTADLDILIRRPNLRDLAITAGSGNDVFRIDPDSVPPVVNDYILNGGVGLDTLRFDTSVEASLLGTLYAGARVFVSGVELVSLGGGSQALAVAGAPDVAGTVQRYWLILTDDIVDAGSVLTIDGRALREHIAMELGADGEIGGTGDDADLIVSDRLIVDGTKLTFGRAIEVLAGESDDALFGGAGNDTLRGGGGDDELYGSEGDDLLVGDAGSDVMLGGAGNDVLDGRGVPDPAGGDRMEGGLGDDVYLVNSAPAVVFEYFGQGSDEVRSVVNYTLPDAVEILTLGGGGDIRGSGNGLANTITGNAGNNRLDGAAGADTMAGGKGHDIYVVNNPADQVIEAGSSGNDTVESAVTFRLPVHFEKLILTGSFGYDGRGNAGANTITGNSGRNFLNGGSGNDVIDGGAGNDRLLGGLGNDVLNGGAGSDRFEFLTAPGAGNVDRILDFSAADDSIYLMRAAFTRIGPAGSLQASAFHAGTAAADAGDRIVYDQPTGRIFYDPDGSGAAAAILFATVSAGTPLSHADFMIYG